MSDTSNPPPDPDSEDSQMDDENETDLEGETEEDEDMDREMDGDTEGTEGEGDDDSMHEVEREEAPSERHRIRLDENLMRMVEGLQSADEQRQAEAADQLAAVLLMANEDTLPPHLPAREMTDALMGMLRKEHNFELMLVAARCLRNLLEAFPRAHSVVVQATPILLHKMRSIECIDIAEQALVTLEDLSRRNHAKAIMINDGISACIEHIDFFPLSSQRLAFRLAANCAAFLSPLHFHLVKQQLPQLSERLFCEDGKCLESICQFFSRLVENVKYDPQKLREIAGKNHRLLVIVQQLLSTHQSSNHLPAPIFFSLLRMVHSMARSCPDLAAALILLDYHTTLKTLLVKNPSGKEELNTDKSTEELAERPVEQLEDLVALAAELSPSLPSSNIFQIDELVFAQLKSSPPVVWFWKDDSQQWNPFRSEAIPSLERGKTAGANRIVLEMGENVYFLNLDAMTQMNATSGKIRQIKREISRNDASAAEDDRLILLRSSPSLQESVLSCLLSPLTQLALQSSSLSLRLECLRCLSRFIFSSSAPSLHSLLSSIPLSLLVASAFSSSIDDNVSLISAALQLIHILLEASLSLCEKINDDQDICMLKTVGSTSSNLKWDLLERKLPSVYGPLLRKEGVTHEIGKLAAVLKKEIRRKSQSSSSIEDIKQEKNRTKKSKKKKLEKAAEEVANGPGSGSGEDEPIAARTRKRSSPESSNSSKSSNSSTASSKVSRLKLSSTPLSSRSATVSTGTSQAATEPGPSSLSAPQQSPNQPGPSSSSAPSSPLFPPSLPSSSAAPAQPVNQQRNSTISESDSNPNLIVRNILDQIATTSGLPSRFSSFAPMSSAVQMTPSAENASTALSTRNIDRIKVWIREQAEQIMQQHFKEEENGSVLEALSQIAKKLSSRNEDRGIDPILQLYNTLKQDSVSAFELAHSGLLIALLEYLTSEDEQILPQRLDRLRRFAQVFLHLTPDSLSPSTSDDSFAVFSSLISKVLAAIAQLEQFQVKLHDNGGIASGGGGNEILRGTQAVRHIQTNQIKLTLRRHPDCKDLQEYRREGSSSIKIDGLASVHSIERFLCQKGITQMEGQTEQAAVGAEERNRRRNVGVQIMIDNTPLPSDWSVLQALVAHVQPPLGQSLGAFLLLRSHQLFYRSVPPSEQTQTPFSANPKVLAKDTAMKCDKAINDKIWKEGLLPPPSSPLSSFLCSLSSLPDSLLSDSSLSALQLLRVLFGLNQHWFCLFEDHPNLPTTFDPILPANVFISAKLSSKVTRQLSDFISVAAQQFPHWTKELVNFVPFAFPFSLRRSYLCLVCLGRDRAVYNFVRQSESDQRESAGSAEPNGRVAHRIERRKVEVQRDALIQSTLKAVNANLGDRALLEVSFSGEAGSGFGPTLEFYTVISREFQKADLAMWYGKETTKEEDADGTSTEYIHCPFGLFPRALLPSSTPSSSLLLHFRLLGRLLAQSLSDSRLFDLPLSPVFLHFLSSPSPFPCVSTSAHLSLLHQLDPHLFTSLHNLSLTPEEDFLHLETSFTLPGEESFELLQGGSRKQVTKHNAKQFIQLVSFWLLSGGVSAQFHALRSGFSQLLDPSLLCIFGPAELDELFCGCGSSQSSQRNWSPTAITQAIKPDHGYSHDSPQIKWLVSQLSSFDREQQRNFVQFVTGSPRLPVGGFSALSPPLTVARKSSADDSELPSAMTCLNYLKLPPYSSSEVQSSRVLLAISHNKCFFLS